jgi:hypothetical protein
MNYEFIKFIIAVLMMIIVLIIGYYAIVLFQYKNPTVYEGFNNLKK